MSIDPERWRRLQPILNDALELPADERRSRVEAACAGDHELRSEIDVLLAADAEAGGVLDGISEAFLDDLLRAADSEGAVRSHGSGVSGDASEVNSRLLPGARIAGRYRIVSLLGRGGMGEVYRADDLRLAQAVALKFLPIALQEKPEYLERLFEEARLARQISHPNVCRVYDVGEWHDRRFLSMEYIDGEDLASLIKRIGHLPRQKAVDIARQLCAGLDAAHHLGILHRDLKPSNVMLDGNGRVRITDFGLAVATQQLEGREARAGTPGYMAPEQLDGREATVRSDVYALGLVLYELFTGRRAFPARDMKELRRLREETSPAIPSLLVENFDPAVERAILRCLETDPALRPASAREVALLLPGGDPLTAALAAGETPSPELIAVSGPEGALDPVLALGTLGAIVAMLVVLVLLNDRASILGWVAWPHSPDALEDNARGILERLGYETSSIDRVRRVYAGDRRYRQYVQQHDRSANRWNPLREPGELDTVFWYRQARRHMMPFNWRGIVVDDDPAPAAGDVSIVTDLRGRLVWFELQVFDAALPAESSAPPDWSRLFAEAGLDPTRFQPTAPTRLPRVAADARAAWRGALSDFGGYPVRVEAAAYRGRPVFFELVLPWDRYWDPAAAETPAPASSRMRRWLHGISVLFPLIVMAALVTRSWLGGRGDRRGAFHLAVAIFALRFAVWVLGGHHVPAILQEWILGITALGTSLVDAAAAWCLYLAVEPYARRVHPRLLVSWTRLLRGRVFDPLVGRHILYGVLLSTVFILFWGQLYVMIPHAIGLSAPPPPLSHPAGQVIPLLQLFSGVPARVLLGGRYVLAAIPGAMLSAFAFTLVPTVFLLGLHVLLRRGWVALIVFAAFFTVLGWPAASYHSVVGLVCSLAGVVIGVSALRFGVVGLLALWFCVNIWLEFPITSRIDTPHFGIGFVGVLIIAGLGAYGTFVATYGFRHQVETRKTSFGVS